MLVTFRITPGQRHDITAALELVDEVKPRCLLAAAA
jgi:hypothetical protein